jgi:hypothetical protein
MYDAMNACGLVLVVERLFGVGKFLSQETAVWRRSSGLDRDLEFIEFPLCIFGTCRSSPTR